MLKAEEYQLFMIHFFNKHRWKSILTCYGVFDFRMIKNYTFCNLFMSHLCIYLLENKTRTRTD
jgi:hypothetical protein